MTKKKSSPISIGNQTSSTKAVFLRVPPQLHAALMAAAGEEQHKRGEKVSVNVLATRILAKAMGFDVMDE